ncbi:class II fructose-bisphosphatase [Vibrio sp. ZSDZ65]|uniref:Fructose-1,6-bisphosphatase n=1 Tax=Vibrio qingdaonensis TaxID=2829491 RepID=A0A9X3HWK3_9VIBR|nr:class II fructose-bisphosphatase [Vibrio qingdaonensis]MCW8345877.1 class II fructose-bisphosphatase [Vibrio qingdaonensis]
MNTDIALTFVQVTEGAALAGYQWLGCGNKENADQAAVEAMRLLLSNAAINGKIVIGEGEIDDAPMLFIGEELGQGGPNIDIAVDPIEGTRMTAMGQSNAIAVLAASEQGSLLQAPDMYMEKLVVGPKSHGAIDLDLSLEDNLTRIAQSLSKPINELVMATLAKPRHDGVIKQVQSLGVRVYAFPDGDVAASLLTCMPESDIDLMYCIGGSPEGVITAAAMQALGGDMQAKLLFRDQVKGQSTENQLHAQIEQQRCVEMHVKANTKLELNDLASSKNVIFSATGITKGDLLEGVKAGSQNLTTETLLIHGQSRIIRKIRSTHDFSLLNSELHAKSA